MCRPISCGRGLPPPWSIGVSCHLLSTSGLMRMALYMHFYSVQCICVASRVSLCVSSDTYIETLFGRSPEYTAGYICMPYRDVELAGFW